MRPCNFVKSLQLNLAVLVIGIDLGETESRVSISKNDDFVLIVDGQGYNMTPSYVAFTNRGPPLVGFAAKEQAASNTKNTVYDIMVRGT